MAAQKLFYWSNIALVLSGLVEILVSFQELTGWTLVITALAGWVLLMLGLAGLHARQAKKAGRFGYIGLGLLIIGSILALVPVISANTLFSNNLLTSSTAKSIAYLLFETSIVVQTGYFLYGLASLRAGIFPQAVSVLLVITVVLMIVAGNFGQGLSMSAIGIILLNSKARAESV
jgi:hypothetical protein